MSTLVNESITTGISSVPVAVRPSPEEVSKGELRWKNLERALRALHRDSLVVLENVIDDPILDILNEKMVKDSVTLQSRGEERPYTYNKGLGTLHRSLLQY